MGFMNPAAIVAIILALGNVNVLAGQNIVRHGNSYTIQSVLDDNLYLTATQHHFRAKYGVYVGKVLTNDYHGGPNQFWDAITWPETEENQFWLYAKAAALNEITAVPLTNAAIPPKNLVEILYVNLNSTPTVYRNKRFQFLIKSLELGQCVESHGLDYQISYETCSPDRIEQLWTADPFVDDAVTRTDGKSFCQFLH